MNSFESKFSGISQLNQVHNQESEEQRLENLRKEHAEALDYLADHTIDNFVGFQSINKFSESDNVGELIKHTRDRENIKDGDINTSQIIERVITGKWGRQEIPSIFQHAVAVIPNNKEVAIRKLFELDPEDLKRLLPDKPRTKGGHHEYHYRLTGIDTIKEIPTKQGSQEKGFEKFDESVFRA